VAPFEQVCVPKDDVGCIKGGSVPLLPSSPGLLTSASSSSFEDLSLYTDYQQTSRSCHVTQRFWHDHHGVTHRSPRPSIPTPALRPESSLHCDQCCITGRTHDGSQVIDTGRLSCVLSLAQSESFRSFHAKRPTHTAHAPTSRLEQPPQYTCYTWQTINHKDLEYYQWMKTKIIAFPWMESRSLIFLIPGRITLGPCQAILTPGS
jgi:hypothetical protein